MGEDDMRDRITRLETLSIERDSRQEEIWRAHDKRSDERWTDLMEKVHEMQDELKQRPCSEHIMAMTEILGKIKQVEIWQEKHPSHVVQLETHNSRILAIEKWINIAGWAIGVIYAAIIAWLIKHFLG